MDYAKENIVFYDGECGFCNKTVQFILKHERKSTIFFSALQSDFAKKFFKDNHAPEPDLSTFYFYTNYALFSKSTGALALSRLLRFPFPLLQISRIIPVCQRDQLYNFIAKRRHKLSNGYCYLPTEEELKRFIK